MIIKKISVVCSLLLILSVTNVSAQIGSVYSVVGLGDVANGGFGQNAAMGGMGIGMRSNLHVNNLNPASYTAIDSLSVLYELGLSGGFNQVESSTSSTLKKDTRIDYIALGFKAKPFWGVGIGITPSTRVNYTLLSQNYSVALGNFDTYYNGEGGVTRAYWTNSFRILENLHLGIRASYEFGSIQRITSVIFRDATDVTTNTKYEYTTYVSGFAFDYGLQYVQPINENSSLTLGLVYENKMNVNSSVDVFGITTNDTVYNQGISYDINEGAIVDTVVSSEGIEGKITLPSSFGGGATYQYKDKLIIGADVFAKNWSELSTSEATDQYKNSISYRGGLEWTPSANSVNKYYKRIKYRLGGHYTKSHIVINDYRVNDYGVSFGFGFPMRNSNTSFNITGELGQRGTTDGSLLKESYGIISLNLTLSDIWFFKRKFK